MSIQKLVRTLQNYGPFGRDTTEAVQQLIMRARRRPHERDFQAIRFCPPEALFVDVGANHGQSILSITLVAPRATIVAFEPNLRLAGKIKRRWQANPLVTVHAVGLSDRPATLPLYVPSYRGMVYDGLASFDRREAVEWLNGDALYGFRPERLTVDVTECSLSTLDSFTFSQQPYLIKVDAQGHEYKVLAGGTATLASAHPVLLVEGPWRDPAIAPHLRKLGYARYEFDGGAAFTRVADASSSQALNSFFVTDERRAELIERGALFQ
jgi:FkbM family methyltransferase